MTQRMKNNSVSAVLEIFYIGISLQSLLRHVYPLKSTAIDSKKKKKERLNIDWDMAQRYFLYNDMFVSSQLSGWLTFLKVANCQLVNCIILLQ